MDSLRRRPARQAPPQKAALPTQTALPPTSPAPQFRARQRRLPLPRRRQTSRRWFWIAPLIILFFVFGFGTWLLWKVNTVSQRISVTDAEHEMSFFSSIKHMGTLATSPLSSLDTTRLRQDTNGRINILLLGRAGEHHPGKNLTDTIMIMSIDTQTKRVGLLSLPRDLYVQIPDTQTYTKINSLYQIGVDNHSGVDIVRHTVEAVTGLDVHYFVVVDFDAFEKIVDTLGGIGVYAERDIYDARYPGPNYSYETFELSKGWHVLDGATALKYVRERHDDPEGDFGRAKRQQQVLQAVKEQALSLGTLANPFTINTLLDTLGDNVQTDISASDIPAFLALSRVVDTKNISNAVVDAWKPDSLLRVSHVQVGPVAMFILVPRVGNWNEIHDLATNLFDLGTLQRQSEEIDKEQAIILIENRSGHPEYADRLARLLRDQFGFRAVSTASNSSSDTSDLCTIIDHTHGQKPWSLDALLKKLPATLDTSGAGILSDQHILEPGSGDFRIIVGRNISELFRYEEASREDYQKDQDASGYSEFLPPTPEP